MEHIEETATTVADAATVAAGEGLGHPAKQAHRLERKGAPVNRRLASRAQDLVRDTATTGLRLVKSQARRQDVVGEATYRALELVHGGLGNAARTLGRLEEATQPPARPTGSRPAAGSAQSAARGPRPTTKTARKNA